MSDFDWKETYRGIVEPGDCDVLEHMNIAAFVRKFDGSNYHVLHWLGLGPRVARETGLSFVAVEIHTRFLGEVRAGDAIVNRSAILGVDDPLIHYATEMRNAETDEVVAVFEEVACCFDRVARCAAPLPEIVLARIGLTVPLTADFEPALTLAENESSRAAAPQRMARTRPHRPSGQEE